MPLSEMFGVKRDTDFLVKGYEPRFRLTLNVNGVEHLEIKHSWSDAWETPLMGTIFNVISLSPSGIIHLPPPLTNEQREQLRSIWTLGGRWIARDGNGNVFAYDSKPQKIMHCCHWNNDEDGECFTVIRELSVCALVSWSDLEPYDIGKALGVE